MSFKNRLIILSSSFLIFAAVPPAPAAQLTPEKNNHQTEQDRANDANRKQSTEQIRQVQTALKNRGFNPGRIDGIMGAMTVTAIRNFQMSQGMTATGLADQPTLTALQIGVNNATQQSSADIGVGPTAFDLEDVRQAQMVLKNRGYDPGDVNGMISSQTQEAIRKFQSSNNLPITGKLDQPTQAALGISVKGTDQNEQRAKPGRPSAEPEQQ